MWPLTVGIRDSVVQLPALTDLRSCSKVTDTRGCRRRRMITYEIPSSRDLPMKPLDSASPTEVVIPRGAPQARFHMRGGFGTP